MQERGLDCRMVAPSVRGLPSPQPLEDEHMDNMDNMDNIRGRYNLTRVAV